MQTNTQPAAAQQNLSSLRHHPELKPLLKQAEARQMSDAELAEYCRIVPQHADRAAAAAEIAQVEQQIVDHTVDEMLAAYPMAEQFGEYAHVKCARDVVYISAYATMAMLIDDTRWFDDKLLFWARTMLHAAHFPPPSEAQAQKLFSLKQANPLAHLIEQASHLPAHLSIIHVTYKRLLENYRETLSPDAYQLLEPMMEHAITVITSE